jgi:hypothetical protein
MKIFCIGVSGKPVTETLADVLLYNAHDLIEKAKKKGRDTMSQRIKGRDYDGIIKTSMQRQSLSIISGIMFQATVMTPLGETEVRYIVRDQDLEGLETSKFHQMQCAPN